MLAVRLVYSRWYVALAIYSKENQCREMSEPERTMHHDQMAGCSWVCEQMFYENMFDA